MTDAVAMETAVETPYPGLRPFREDEARHFFGQDVPLADLRKRLYNDHFVAILGLSGSGKSSLLKAGLLAEIRPKQIRGPRQRWLIGYMKPGGDPLRGLIGAVSEVESQLRAQKARLKEAIPAAATGLEGALLLDGYGLARYGHEAQLSEGQDILIVVDQFEELFRYQRDCATHKDKDRAAQFVQLLLEAARDKECHVSVVITMRSEFIGDCALFFGLAEQVNEGTFLLPKMTRDQIEEVILGPAEEGGFQIDPGVVQELLNETEKQGDGLPLLQHALRRMHRHWQGRGATGPVSTADLSSFQTTPPEGTLLIKHHLDDHLNSVYESLKGNRKIAAKLLFRLLSERDARGRVTRRPLPFSDIVRYSGANLEDDLRAVINAFRDEEKGRTFLTPEWPKPLETEVVDISHECLLRRWERLRKWIDYEQHDAEQFRRLAEDTDKTDLQALESGEPRKPLEGTTLEHFLKWRRESQVVGAAWALRYEGEYSQDLGRPLRSFAAAEQYLNWSALEAKARADKAKADEEKRIRDEERLEQAKVEAKLATERIRRYVLMAVLAVLVVLGAVLVYSAKLNLRAQQTEQRRLQDQANAEQERRLLAEQIAKTATANAAEQERLKDVQAKTADQLRDSLQKLEVAQGALQAKNTTLENVNRQLEQTSSDLTRANDDLGEANNNLRAQTSAAYAARTNAEAAAEQARTAATEARTARAEADRLRIAEKQEGWLEAVILAGEAFGNPFIPPLSRRSSIASALDDLEEATDKIGLDAQIKELYVVRKAGLRALGEAVVAELVVSRLQTGPGEAACYTEDTKTIFSLLVSEGLRRSPSNSSSGFALFRGHRRARGSFFDPILTGVMRIYRSPFYTRRDDLGNARDLSDDCGTAAIGSPNGLIDRYDIALNDRMMRSTDNDLVKRYLTDNVITTAAPLKQRGSVEMARLSPKGERLVASFAGHGWQAWQLGSNRLIAGGDKLSAASAAFSPNGRWLLLAESSGRTSRFDLEATKPTATVTFSGCCTTPATGARQQSDVTDDGTVAWFDGGSSEVKYTPPSSPVDAKTFAQKGRAAVRAVRMSPDGKLLAAGREDGSVDVWPVSGATPIRLPDQSAPPSAVSGLSWSKSGQYLTVLHGSGTIHVFRVRDDSAGSKVEQIQDLLRRIDNESQKEKPGDTRALAKAVGDLLGR